MNYGLHISCMVEEKLALIQRPVDWTQADEAQAYERCLKEALEENGRAWADGNIRVGDYILLSSFNPHLFASRGPSLVDLQPITNTLQLIPILVSLRIVFLMLAPKWNSPLKLVSCNSLPVSCKL